MPDAPAAYSVTAVNVAHASENKVHDDAVARRLGFGGGLVPGVDVYAYATHAAVARWGRDWLERGTMEILLKKPVYEGNTVEVSPQEAEDGLLITVRSMGELCGTATARLPAAGEAVPPLSGFPETVPPEHRPAATAAALPPGRTLGSHPHTVTSGLAADYLRDMQERHALYAEGGLVHPGTVLRMCNWALAHSLRMPAWIHVGSTVRNFGVARVGETLTARAKVLATFERKGHQFVDLDAVVVANGARPVARVTHTAIYLPRQLAEADRAATQ